MHSQLLQALRNPITARSRFVAGTQGHIFTMRFAQPTDPFFHRRQIVAD
jgi:hypothetical protein